MLKFAVVPPAGTVFWLGGMALALFEVNLITAPPTGAPALSVAFPRQDTPPTTVEGESVNEIKVGSGGVTVSGAVSVVPLYVAEMVAVTFEVTVLVVMLKLAVVSPAGTVLWLGGVAAELLDENLITAPPVGATPPSAAVPRLEVPPTTEIGETVNEIRVGSCGVTVN